MGNKNVWSQTWEALREGPPEWLTEGHAPAGACARLLPQALTSQVQGQLRSPGGRGTGWGGQTLPA